MCYPVYGIIVVVCVYFYLDDQNLMYAFISDGPLSYWCLFQFILNVYITLKTRI